MRDWNERSHESIACAGLASQIIHHGKEADLIDVALKLMDMAGEVQRLNAVIDNIVAMYTKVDQPLADYLRETGDLR